MGSPCLAAFCRMLKVHQWFAKTEQIQFDIQEARRRTYQGVSSSENRIGPASETAGQSEGR